MAQLSLEPYKGTRDFYPQDQFIQNYIFFVWRDVAQKYGYLEYGASILEETELYKAKSGEEIVNEQTYTFQDRGGRDVTIRPEMTPTVARMVAQKRRELTFPLRWFSIPNLFRYERPQRGRLREHWQLNVDMFGVDSMEADVEIVDVAANIMRSFGAQEDQFVIRINNRKFLNFLLHEVLNLTPEQAHAISKIMDKKDKISSLDVDEMVKEKMGDSERAADVANFINRGLDFLPDEKYKNNEDYKQLEEIQRKLLARGLKNVVIDEMLVRGFDYYTGVVFEIFDTNKVNPRALFGGGRYDDLVGIFGVEKVSGLGFGMGDVTIRDFLETHGLLPPYKPAIDIYIAPFDAQYLDDANKLAQELRDQNIYVAVDLTDRKVSAKAKTADREQVPYLLVFGEEERTTGKFKLKDLKESKEFEVTRGDIFKFIKNST